MEAGEDVLLPVVELQLRSGQRCAGRVIELSETTVVLVHGRQDLAATYLALGEIVGIEIPALAACEKLLSFDRVPPPPPPAPSRIELKRRLTEVAGSLSQTLGSAVAVSLPEFAPGDEATRSRLAQVLRDLGDACQEATRDAPGRAALAARLERIAVDPAGSGLHLVAGTLTLGLAHRLSRATIREQLFAAL